MPESGFSAHYWDTIYSQPQTMDGIINASLHADYLQSMFALDAVKVRSVLDVGFGLGYLFNTVIKRFKPQHAVGIEPSTHAFAEARKVIVAPANCRLKLLPIALEDWCASSRRPGRFDLTLCTSVIQYLDDDVLHQVLPVLAQRSRHLYLTVPTDVEAQRMAVEYHFEDGFALHRTRAEYRELLDPHFTVIGNRLLESKHYFDETNTPFSELLFRSD